MSAQDYSLIIIKQPPYQGRTSHEIIEAILSLALFEVPHRVVFFERGLNWLLPEQNPIGHKSLEKQLNALPIYGTDEIFYIDEHQQHITNKNHLSDVAESLSLSSLIQWMRDAKQVEVF